MRILILVTNQFPFGKGETFLENEIEYLAKSFSNIYLYAACAQKGDKCTYELPANVVAYNAEIRNVSKKQYLKSLGKKAVIIELGRAINNLNDVKKISSCCYFDVCVENSCHRIQNFVNRINLNRNDEIVIYSYWLSSIGMTAINLNNYLKNCGYHALMISRIHGFDLYEERAYLNYLPFQEKMIQKFDMLFPCSQQGSRYLQKKYPQYADKIETSYLGVADRFHFQFPKKQEVFHIASCSNVIPLKRVNRIAESLSEITGYQVRWTHFGDGELMNQVESIALNLPKNISVDFRGRVPNKEIYDFYNNYNINLFVNVSTSEGLPVSIMEAISFGIPVIATDVGGTAEIVEDSVNGFLLDKDFTNKELCTLICAVIKMSKMEYESLCCNSRRIYEEKFSAKKNYTVFCQRLAELGEQNVTGY